MEKLTMKTLIISIFTLLISIEAASLNNLVQNDEGNVKFDIDVVEKTYSYRLETPDETVKYEKGFFETDPANGEESLVVEGGYGFVADNGLRYTVTYKADKDGYRPSVIFGSSLGPMGSGGGGFPSLGGGVGSPPTQPPKGIDPALLCSLAGSGCK